MKAAADFDVVGFGFNTVDHVCLVGRPLRIDAKQRLQAYAQGPGGQVPTALVELQRWGLRTAYVGPFGDDDGGRRQRAELEGEGIDCRACRVRPGLASHTSIILVDAVSGARSVLWTRPDGLALRADELDRDVLAGGRALLLDADDVDTALRAATWARAAGALVMLDVDEPGARTDELLALSDAVIVSDRFPQRHTGRANLRAALRAMAARGPSLTAATLGAGGALAWDGRRFHYVAAVRVPVVDATSAGDLFHAGCLHGLLQGWDTPRTLRFAAAAAALACTTLGGRASIP
ncbi:MAG TPA: PfkB family carbohydrate kinase, partial [Candidatus Dormibacteraeota bacterium]|nr:PfkB family carbohydrate kinase [Candidatus Dormibacteraeota bacterium]